MTIQILPQKPSPAAAIGQALSKGLSETIPKEIERYRLSQGLKQFEQEASGLSPLQQGSRLLSIPGVKDSPATLQYLSDIARLQAKGQALQTGAENKYSPYPTYEEAVKRKPEQPGLTTAQPVQETLRPYIPLTQEQIVKRAVEKYPELYKYDPERAISQVEKEDIRQLAISNQIQAQRNKEQNVQNTIRLQLSNRRNQVSEKTPIPDNVYQKLETEAINSVLPRNEGGQGLTETQAEKKYGDEMDKIVRQYSQVKSLGNFFLPLSSRKDIRGRLTSLQKEFKDRNDLENFADKIVADNGISTPKAYFLAYPISENKKILSAINSFKDIPRTDAKGVTNITKSREETKKLIPEIVKNWTNADSPLAIGQKLWAKGYDAEQWMDYVNSHQDEMNLNPRQIRELSKDRDFDRFNLNDMWLFTLSDYKDLLEE